MKITGNVQISTRGMGPSQRELDEWLAHPVTTEFLRRLDSMVSDAVQACEQAALDTDWRKAQGAAAALRRVKEIPRILAGEMRTDEKV